MNLPAFTMDINSPDLMRPVFDFITAAYTTPPAAGLPPGDDPGGMFLTTVWPGITLDSSYANAWSPLNPGGVQAVTENISNLVNPIPNVSSAWSDSGVTVEAAYHEVLYAVPAATHAAAAAGGWAAPMSALAAGPRVTRTVARPVPQPLHSATAMRPDVLKRISDELKRSEAESKYANTGASLFAMKETVDVTRPEQLKKWNAMEPVLEAQVRSSWQALQRAPVVAGLAQRSPVTLFQAAGPPPPAAVGSPDTADDSQGVARMLNDANDIFTATLLASAMQPGLTYHASYLTPASFMDPPAQANWPSTTIPARTGDPNSCEYSFAFTRVDVSRPWLMASLFSMGGWVLDGFAPGKLSTGRVNGNTGSFPLLPVSFVALRNLIVRQNGQTLLSSPGPQILCWMNKIVPYLPPKN